MEKASAFAHWAGVGQNVPPVCAQTLVPIMDAAPNLAANATLAGQAKTVVLQCSIPSTKPVVENIPPG